MAINRQPMPKARPQVQAKTIRRLLSYATSQYKLWLGFVLVCIVLSVFANVAGSMFLKVLIDDYITPLLQVENPVFTGLLRAILTMALIYAVGIVSTYAFNRTMAIISQGVLKQIRDDLFAHMQALPIRFFDSHTHGDLMSRFTNDIDTLRQMLAQSLPHSLSAVLTMITVFCAMVSMSVTLTAVVIACTAGVFLVTKTIGGRSRQYFIKQQASLGRLNGYIEEMINGQQVVKVFCYEEEAKQRFDHLNDELCRNMTQAHGMANILGPVNGNLGHLTYVIVATIGGWLAVKGIGGLTLGMLASFLQLTRSFSGPIGQISQQINLVVMALAGAERVFNLMDEPVEADDGYVTLVNAKYENGKIVEASERTGIWAWKETHPDGTVTYTQLRGDIRFEHVDFGYDDNLVLHDITFHAKPGQKVAFVGATGAGKTTITNLLNRFYDIAEGTIFYDGIDIRKIRKSDLRRSLGIVLQDTKLFTGTVKENIRYGRLDASDEEVAAAARLANADGFISMLPNGYDTVLSGDGSGLSQGQRQLLSIARAAVANSPVLILDEATSSIDTRTEALVQKGMDALRQGRTAFVIAHRLSTVRDSDVIIVLDNGRIIEQGTHDQLIAQRGVYYQLYTGALELE